MQSLLIPQDIINRLNVPQVVDITDKLPVNKNYTWAQLNPVRPLEDLTCIGWHHDAIKKSVVENLTDLQVAINIANTHINLKANEPKGDAGFPYHIWIRNGQAYLCNDILPRTYGIAGHNGYVVHVCVSGEYAYTDAITDADRRALIAITLMLIRALPNYKEVKSHGELNPTACPGYDYNGIREEAITHDIKLRAADTWDGKVKRVANLVNQINYMTGLIKAGPDDGNAQWALNQLYDVIVTMESKKLLS